MFALFLLANSQSPTLQYLSMYMTEWVFKTITVCYASILTLLVLKTFQYFPTRVNAIEIEQTFKTNAISKLLISMLSKKAGIIILFISIITLYIPNTVPYNIVFISILIFAVAFLYLSLKRNKSDRNKVLWLFWGISIYITIFVLISILDFFNGKETKIISEILSIASVVALLLAYTMSLFFYNTFDTGIIVKRTIVNSSIFISIIFIYNVSEHYFLHWLSHKLHLSDVLISSMFSGILVMIFSPLHHKLMHFFEVKLKAKH